jgi:hypothetical protein
LEIFLIHFLLAFCLFFIVNFIGKESSINEYEQISFFSRVDSAPLFNFIYRAFSPVVFIVLVSVFLYKFEYEKYIEDIYLIVIYQFIIRFLFNIFMGRRLLINWKIQFVLFCTSSLLAYFVYIKFILIKEFLFPSNEDIGSAIWLGIIAYLYKTFNNMNFSSVNSSKMQNKYIFDKYKCFKNSFETIIDENTNKKKQKYLVYAVLIMENFNRPKFYRVIENLLFSSGKVKTLGIMQIKTENRINDRESIVLGCKKIVKDWKTVKAEEVKKESNYYSEHRFICNVLDKYNPSFNYGQEGYDIYNKIKDIESEK